MWVLLSLVVFLGGFVRVWGIDQVPPELFGDEIDAGYHAYSLLKTGRDLYGQVLPVYVHSLAEWKAPLLMYSAVSTVAIFGLNEWGVRLPGVISGGLTLVVMYLLAYQTTRNKTIASLTAAVLALTPWHIYYSRMALEVVLMLLLGCLGTLTFLKHRYVLSTIFFVLSLYTYSTAWLFVPVWIGALAIQTRFRPGFKAVGLFLLLVLPLAAKIFFGPATGRFKSINFTANPEIVDKIVTLRQESGPLAGLIFHNKLESYAAALTKNYLLAFSTDFLFVRGDPIYRHSIQVIGQLLPVFAPFLVIGLYQLAKRRQWLWLTWLVLAPIPSALTIEGGYHALRLIWMVPPLVVAVAAGISVFKPKLVGLIWLLIVIQFVGAAYYYWVHYSRQSWRWWAVGYKDALTELARLEPNYDRIYINNTYETALIRFLLWTKYSPQLFHQQFTTDKQIANVLPGFDGFKLGDKYYFGAWSKRPIDYQAGSLYLLSARDDEVGNGRIIYTSTNSYGEPILYLVIK